MKGTNKGLSAGLERLEAELIVDHGIGFDIFESGFITVGADEGWRDALERKEIEKKESISDDLRRNEVASEQRRITRIYDSKFRLTPEQNWNLYSVYVTPKGDIKPWLEWAGQRLHPTARGRRNGEIKFDCTCTQVKVFLPPLSWESAMHQLDHHGFVCTREQYTSDMAWRFIFDNQQIPIWVEESALKAMASTCNMQIAVGLNGINSAGQKTRSDRLRKPLEMLAKGGRQMVVRFDHGKNSERAARRLTRQLKRAGAVASWWIWPSPQLGKSDDFLAAKYKAIVAGTFDRSEDYSNFHVVGENKQHYSRLNGDWETTTICREFAPMDLIHARAQCRVIALEGPTGTGKTKAAKGAVDLMEEILGHKVIVLGLYHRASLTHKGAADFGVRDLSSPPGTFERECGRVRDGLFSCCESIKKDSGEWDLVRWSWELQENPRPVVLFLDEITQMAQHLLLAGTPKMRSIRREAIKALERLIRNPEVTVIAAEAGIGDIELEWLAALSGEQPHLINTTFRRRSDLFTGAATADNIDKLQQLCGLTLDQNHQVWISMGQVTALHSFCGPFPDKFLIHGENSKSEEVAALMSDTNTVASQYSLIGYSPAIVSGISYEASTVGIAACVQQAFMGPQDAMQAVARARSAVLRIMLSPVSVPGALIGTGETTEVGVRRAKGETINPELRELYQDHMREVDPATLRYSVALEARINYEAINNEHVLRCRLEDQGYNLRHFEELHDQANAIVPRAERIKQTKQAELDHRTRLLHEVMTGQKTISQAASEAARETKNGTWVDLAAIDPSHAYGWLLRLRVQDLIAAETFTTQTSEFQAMATEVQVLNKHEARELRGVLGGRVTIPGPDDEVSPPFAKALLKMAGFTVERKRIQDNGVRAYNYKILGKCPDFVVGLIAL